MAEDKEKAAEKDQGTTSPAGGQDELTAEDMERVAGGCIHVGVYVSVGEPPR
jgi:hypothetical protein